jgi:beta-N-acetylhexosaminidase
LVHQEVIRGHMGYDGLLMSDDLSMHALTDPSFRARAEAVFAAGSDIALHCNGKMPEMEAVAAGSPRLTAAAKARFDRAIAITRTQAPFSMADAEACLADVLALVA